MNHDPSTARRFYRLPQQQRQATLSTDRMASVFSGAQQQQRQEPVSTGLGGAGGTSLWASGSLLNTAVEQKWTEPPLLTPRPGLATCHTQAFAPPLAASLKRPLSGGLQAFSWTNHAAKKAKTSV